MYQVDHTQIMMDTLERNRDAGLISEEEYDREMDSLIKSANEEVEQRYDSRI